VVVGEALAGLDTTTRVWKRSRWAGVVEESNALDLFACRVSAFQHACDQVKDRCYQVTDITL
jgi:hypothetical protein